MNENHNVQNEFNVAMYITLLNRIKDSYIEGYELELPEFSCTQTILDTAQMMARAGDIPSQIHQDPFIFLFAVSCVVYQREYGVFTAPVFESVFNAAYSQGGTCIQNNQYGAFAQANRQKQPYGGLVAAALYRFLGLDISCLGFSDNPLSRLMCDIFNKLEVTNEYAKLLLRGNTFAQREFYGFLFHRVSAPGFYALALLDDKLHDVPMEYSKYLLNFNEVQSILSSSVKN